MEKGIITFKRNTRLTFHHYLRNRWPPTAARKCDAVIRLIKMPLRMCHGIGM